jgi:hypothetical protein
MIYAGGWLHCGSFPQTGDHVERILYGLLRAQVEMRCLTVSERPSSTFCAIVCGFPFGIAQELAQVFELGRRHPPLGTLELRHGLIGGAVSPGFIKCFCFGQGSSLAIIIGPELIPTYKERAHNLQLFSNWAGQENIYLLLLVGGQVFRSVKQKKTVFLESFTYLLDLIPT